MPNTSLVNARGNASRLSMARFVGLCAERCIDPGLVVENPRIAAALRAKDLPDKAATVARLLDEEF